MERATVGQIVDMKEIAAGVFVPTDWKETHGEHVPRTVYNEEAARTAAGGEWVARFITIAGAVFVLLGLVGACFMMEWIT
jgi:hypothetical protein